MPLINEVLYTTAGDWKIMEETLSDGSKVYNIVGPDYYGDTIRLAASDLKAAEAAVDALMRL